VPWAAELRFRFVGVWGEVAALMFRPTTAQVGGYRTAAPSWSARTAGVAPRVQRPRRRARVVAYGRPASALDREAGAPDVHAPTAQMPRHLRRQWAELMRRGFGMDVLACPKCGGRLRLLALITDRSTVRKLLRHAKLPTVPLHSPPRRAPPEPDGPFDDVA
jgi:hypothetical protein